MQIDLLNEHATEQLATILAPKLVGGMCIFMHGNLGAGKTTFARALLRQLGVTGAVKSPTYTLVEPYVLDQFTLYHLDLYRIVGAEELEYLGLDECFAQDTVALIEWPDHGSGYLPVPDLECWLEYAVSDNNDGRQMKLVAKTPIGESLIADLQREWPL